VTGWFRGNPVEAVVAVRGALEIRRPWLRPSSAVTAQAGGFFTVTNKGMDPDRLVGARSPAAERIEVHAIKVMGATIKMRPLADGLVIHAGNTLTLRPRGYHLLLLGLEVTPRAGVRLPATLLFEKTGSIDVEFLVEAAGKVGEATLDESR
jgi:copper(I)-binding protein